MCPRLGRQLAGGDDGAGSGSLSGMRGAVSGVYGARSPAASSVAPSSPPPPPEIELEIESWNAPNHASKLPPPASGMTEEDEAEDELEAVERLASSGVPVANEGSSGSGPLSRQSAWSVSPWATADEASHT